MLVSFKKILVFQNLNETVSKLNLSAEEYQVVRKMAQTTKKLAPHIEEFQEMVEDLKLDHCMKEGQKIIRENGQLQWTAEGEKAFRKAYKELLSAEVEVSVSPISYNDLLATLPEKALISEWESVEELLSRSLNIINKKMGKQDSQIYECFTVFLSVLGGISGVCGLYATYTKVHIPVVVWMSILFTLNYWLCFYGFKRKK